ncbi:MAG: amidase [Terriglobales bacterium]|jgi:aspartyl-tRNA(Asn)/glutamyl-tRNA(Gln) amidotransferase subunit A
MLTSILEIGQRLRKRELSPVELAKDCLAKIERLNPVLDAFITVTAELALAQARQAEAEIQRGQWRGPLHGVPIGLKDIVDTAGTRTTAASALFKDRIPSQDAEVVRRLRNAGAVFLGKQNLHEFAYGGSSMISYYGEVHNPWNPSRIAGGSSGGSAAAVAAGLGYGAIGTDTAGSIREPAAQCGVVGIKPTYGRVSARGVIPLSASLDHVGPIGRTVSDVAVLLQAVAGFDPEDPNSVDAPVADYLAALQVEPKPARIGVPREFFYEDLDTEVASAVEQALDVLTKLGCELREVNLDVPADRTLQAAESFAYHRDLVARSPELYQPETLRRIRSGENISEAQMEAARQSLAKARHDVQSVFTDLDLLVTPAVPIPAPPLAELKEHPDLLRPRELVLLRNTRPFNVWGLPAISVPCGFTRAGLPVGLQIAGPPWSEAAVLSVAHAYEQATSWHKREPDLISQ